MNLIHHVIVFIDILQFLFGFTEIFMQKITDHSETNTTVKIQRAPVKQKGPTNFIFWGDLKWNGPNVKSYT